MEYNFKDRATLDREGLGYAAHGEGQGLSVFVRGGDGGVLHTCSTHGRGAATSTSSRDATPAERPRPVR